MFRKLIKNKKAQNTAEYAILISLVVAGVIAMQTYGQRALQARVRDAAQYLSNQTSGLGDTTSQYEPYYLSTSYNVVSDDTETKTLDTNVVRMSSDAQTNREAGGVRESQYLDSAWNLETGL
ncbi:MAG TPA: hypothetical protein DD723_10415 [Candidatus Omnitrophica bacterium]|nr:MAG: hypothetical protein A2Z81_06095 [Omnitrophica WOR_2 bacterium GWA2_45_18]OGX19739.1 MAG: hypothetical protein A2Y04_04940 [Omnitrophica WOR_2 bacterium GWC2_45_7]HBR15929.1 hypothetical protein [Candidatus Omnitrophota bacterium]